MQLGSGNKSVMDGTPGLNNAGMVFVRAVVSRLGMLVTSLGFWFETFQRPTLRS
jgi:hypothetical protein